MPYRLRDLRKLAATPAGRTHISRFFLRRMWPVSSRLAILHRRTLGRSTRIVAIVGSLGKSSARRTVAAVLGLPPDAQLFNSGTAIANAVLAVSRRQPHAVIEVGISGRGQMRRYGEVLRPDVVVVTSIGSEHHRSLGTLDITRDEKAWMLRALRPGGVAVLNGDDPNVMWMAGETSARVVTYGFGVACDVRAEDASLDWPRGMRFRLAGFGQSREVAIRLLGRHLIYPALGAFAVSQLLGVDPDDAIARLGALPPTPGRMEPVAMPGGVTLLRDDIKSTTESIDAALALLAEVPARRRIAVLGSISEPVDPQRRSYRRIGELVAKSATHLLVAGPDRPKYLPGAAAGGLPHDCVIDAGRTPAEVAGTLAKLLEPGDVVLVKGRDTQKLDRIRLILSGRTVRCDVAFCNVKAFDCESCPMLGRAWGGIGPPA